MPFRNAALWKSDTDLEKLRFSRAYTLTLSPQIIYARSTLLSQLVSSKVYKQLEFQAVGNWWIYEASRVPPELKRLPNGREDIFEDSSIDKRSKRSLMKFLKFVVEYQNHIEVWEAFAEKSLSSFLTSQFKLPENLQTIITALTLSLDTADMTTVRYALPRIARHLTSIGVLGPGFGAVVPKWGGGAEIAQVACRAGAVGGGVYVLGIGIKSSQRGAEDKTEIVLSNGETVSANFLVKDPKNERQRSTDTRMVSRIIAIVSSPLTTLFEISIESSPLAAVSVVVFPPGSLNFEGQTQNYPIYIMTHSSDTGECPAGQCLLYATTLHVSGGKSLLEAAVSKFLDITGSGVGKLLYSLYYEQEEGSALADLAFNDELLEEVQARWRTIVGVEEGQPDFMQFEERTSMNDEDEENETGY